MSHKIKPMTESDLTPTARRALEAIHAAGTNGIRAGRVSFTRSHAHHHQTLSNLVHGGLITMDDAGLCRLTANGVLTHYRMTR